MQRRKQDECERGAILMASVGVGSGAAAAGRIAVQPNEENSNKAIGNVVNK